MIKKLIATIVATLMMTFGCAVTQPWENLKEGQGYCTDVAQSKIPYACADVEHDKSGKPIGLLDIYKFVIDDVVYIMAQIDQEPFDGVCDSVFVVYEVPGQVKSRHGFIDAPLVAPVGAFACEEWEIMIDMHKSAQEEYESQDEDTHKDGI